MPTNKLDEAQEAAREAIAALAGAWREEPEVDAAAAVASVVGDAFLFAVEALGLTPYVDVERAVEALCETTYTAVDEVPGD